MGDEATRWLLRWAALEQTSRWKQRLLEQFGGPAEVFLAGPDAWRAAGLKAADQAKLTALANHDTSAWEQRCESLAIALLTPDDAAYPGLLRTIPDPPAALFCRGQLPPLGLPCVGVVGTRRPSPYGELVAETLSAQLAEAGVGIVSGLAAGIDSRAHEAALRAGGYTLAVLGNGVDRPWPQENQQLCDRILESGGGVVSEFPLGSAPRSWHFPVRNRVISGCSLGVLVVQAPVRSGALITADLANEQGREVMAVPGPINDRRSGGCHQLIRGGAALVTDAEEILAVLRLERQRVPVGPPATPSPPAAGGSEAALPPRGSSPAPTLNAVETKVAAALDIHPLSIDDLIAATALGTPEVQSALVTLELKGVARRLPGNQFTRAS